MSRAKVKPVKAWGGFSDGKLDWYVADQNFAWEATLPAIFRSRAEARERYEDYRRVTITVDQPRKGKKK